MGWTVKLPSQEEVGLFSLPQPVFPTIFCGVTLKIFFMSRRTLTYKNKNNAEAVSSAQTLHHTVNFLIKITAIFRGSFRI